jgi:hypothetical protein
MYSSNTLQETISGPNKKEGKKARENFVKDPESLGFWTRSIVRNSKY